MPETGLSRLPPSQVRGAARSQGLFSAAGLQGPPPPRSNVFSRLLATMNAAAEIKSAWLKEVEVRSATLTSQQMPL